MRIQPPAILVAAIASITLLPIGLAQPVEPPPAASPALQATTPERWRGQITFPGTALGFLITLTPSESGMTGTMDIPAQGLAGGRLDSLAVTDKEISFILKPAGAPESAWAHFSFKISDDGKSAAGQLSQGGQILPATLTRLDAGEDADIAPKRPQTPKPPFPYEAREVTYMNAGAGVTLAATLTLPSGPGPHPAVVLVTGSGQQDRDETLFDHKPFLVIADYLTRAGIAVLRADDRGIGGSSGPVEAATTDDFTGDCLAGVEFLSTLPEIDHSKIGVIGHSEGGLIAPLAASRSDKVAFIVMLAGPGLPGRDIILAQSQLIMRDAGADEATIAAQAAQSAAIYDLLEAGAADDQVRAEVRRIAEQQMSDAEARGGADAEQARAARAGLDSIVEQQTRQVASPWFRHFLVYDPRPTLRLVHCPVLALNGEFDRQVPPEANLAEVRKALTEGGNRDITITQLPALNHLLQTCDAATALSYANIEETISPVALDAMASWIRRHTELER